MQSKFESVVHVFFRNLTVALLLVVGGCGGGSSKSVSVSSGISPLYTSAPATLNIQVGEVSTFKVGGGAGLNGANYTTYAASTSNSSVVSVSLVAGQTTLTITGVSQGSASVVVTDSAGNAVTIAVVVGNGSTGSQPIVIKAPSGGIVVGQQLASSYAVTGGTGNYTVSVSNSTVLTASINGNVLVLTGVSAGTANVAVFDSSGNSASISVTVSTNGSALPLFVSAPDTVTLPANGSASYSISGGTSPYTAVTSNVSTVTASIANGLLTVNGITAGGTATIQVVDSVNNSKTFTVNVDSSGVSVALLTTAPTAGVTISSGSSATYAIFGGSPPYSVVSSNASAATVSVSGTTFTITGVSSALLVVGVVDSLGATVEINVTVP